MPFLLGLLRYYRTCCPPVRGINGGVTFEKVVIIFVPQFGSAMHPDSCNDRIKHNGNQSARKAVIV